jgi:hypothetical protein
MTTERLTADEMFLKSLGFDEPPKHKVIMHWYDIVVLMESYAVVTTEDMYPKKFVEWIGENCLYFPDTDEWSRTQDNIDECVCGTDELFEYWINNIKK